MQLLFPCALLGIVNTTFGGEAFNTPTLSAELLRETCLFAIRKATTDPLGYRHFAICIMVDVCLDWFDLAGG